MTVPSSDSINERTKINKSTAAHTAVIAPMIKIQSKTPPDSTACTYRSVLSLRHRRWLSVLHEKHQVPTLTSSDLRYKIVGSRKSSLIALLLDSR